MGKSDDELAVVASADGEAAASVIKEHLESEGIPAMLRHESTGLNYRAFYAPPITRLGGYEVLVPRRFADRAKEIIESAEPLPDDFDPGAPLDGET